MEYKICKLQFSTGLHIGKGMLTDGEPIFMVGHILFCIMS